MEKTYVGRVEYPVNGGTCLYERKDFYNVPAATTWIFECMTDIAQHWGDIEPDGLPISATVSSVNGDYCDCYHLVCG